MLNKNPRIEEAPLQDDLMLFNPESSQFYVLNATMASIWRRCDGSHSVESMVEGLSAEFDGVDHEAAASDVRDACQELISHGLVIDSQSATS